MKTAIVTAGFVIAQTLSMGAFAQGEVGGMQKAPTPSNMTSAEKSQARAERKADAAAANRAGNTATKMGEVGPVKPAPRPSTMSKEEKAASREAKSAGANKPNPNPQAGEVGLTK